MALSLIWAQGMNRVIGARGAIPWRVPEDMRHFAEITQGHTVLMGRKTWDSLPAKARPLPGRRNIVLTRDTSWRGEGAVAVTSIEEMLRAASGDVWCIGGSSLYSALLPCAERCEVTLIDIEPWGDSYAPKLGTEWHLLEQGPWATSATELRYRFETWTRRVPPSDPMREA